MKLGISFIHSFFSAQFFTNSVSFSSNISLFLSSNQSISFSIFLSSIFTVLVSTSATEFNEIYVKLYKLAIFISEKLMPCFLHLHATMMKSVMLFLEHIYMGHEVNSNWFEISLWGKISLRCEVTSLSAFT